MNINEAQVGRHILRFSFLSIDVSCFPLPVSFETIAEEQKAGRIVEKDKTAIYLESDGRKKNESKILIKNINIQRTQDNSNRNGEKEKYIYVVRRKLSKKSFPFLLYEADGKKIKSSESAICYPNI